MDFVTSADGTRIAFDEVGKGRPLILVLGAFNSRVSHAVFAAALAVHFTVYNYDRRGRGASGDTQPWSVDREVEDIAALAEHAGGEPLLFGYSSGAVLALKAAATVRVGKLAIYDAPLAETPDVETPRRIDELVEAGRRGDAVALFQKVVGIPEDMTAKFRQLPFWAGLEAAAHTLVYDTTITADATVFSKDVPSITAPALVLAGGAGSPMMPQAGRRIANALPDGRFQELDGQNHDIVPEVMVPVLREFFGA
jgi:pimeloyl-ACP methyl ester carboxylesterase